MECLRTGVYRADFTTDFNLDPRAFQELIDDSGNRFLIFGLSNVVQVITLDCPTALVWHYFGEKT